MKKINKTPLAAAMGTAIITAFTATSAQAEANPFTMTELSDGYMQVAESDTGSSYTVKPWGKKTTEASCGEGKCGGTVKKDKEAACGSMHKTAEGKCGEGKCSGMMDGKKMKKGMESSCGAMMKGKEGACGAMDKATEKTSEGKCGEGKCGGMMDGKKMKKGMESSCGAMMKGKEGACGNMDK